jgi:hypothetical protein
MTTRHAAPEGLPEFTVTNAGGRHRRVVVSKLPAPQAAAAHRREE